jgi:hypothetical protein
MDLATFKSRVIRLLGDEVIEQDYGEPIAGNIYSAAALLDACCAALDAITVRVWKQSIHEIEETGTEFDLPIDLIEIEGVYDNENEMLVPQLPFVQGHSLTVESVNAWIPYPYGCITFMNELNEDGALIYYSANWAYPEEDEDVLEPPEIASTALCFYAASYLLLSQAATTGSIRQFNQKVDSGAPTDNPVKDMSTYFLNRYETELRQLPQRQKGITQ